MMSVTRTITALKRWSCQSSTKPLPAVQTIRSIHVYDFDNTLFSSPLPNKQIWATNTFGQLQAQDFLHNGGWWHCPSILSSTGEGVEIEEARAWEGFWNEKIVELVRLSMEDDAALCVLLTGRMEGAFGELLQRMVTSKGLKFDMLCLKPTISPNGETFSSTMAFKQALLRDIVYTYADAEEIRVYEDRPKHTKGFRDYFEDMNTTLASTNDGPRGTIRAEIIQVSELESSMNPVTEVGQVQLMINNHNSAILDGTAPSNARPYMIKRSVFYTGYLIDPKDTEKLESLVSPPANCPDHELKMLANNILITPYPAPQDIVDKVGGIGAKLRWKVTHLGVFDQKVWAARVTPVDPKANSRVHTINPTPYVVLATRRQAKPIDASRIRNWQPVSNNDSFEFETKVGEKVLLRIEEERAIDNESETTFSSAKTARKHPREEDFPPLGQTSRGDNTRGRWQGKPQHSSRGAWADKGVQRGGGGGIGFAAQRGGGNNNPGNNNTRGGRGGGGSGGQGFRGGRGGGGGGQRGNRGGRGRGGYRSLDANVGGQTYGGGSMEY